MSWPTTTHAFSMACGVGGAFLDVSEYVLFNEGDVTRRWGQPSGFSDVRPGTFEFTLDNSDGRFTPGAAILDTPVVEGMRVCWQLNGRLLEGTIRSVELLWPDVANPDTARVRLQCEDALGVAARTRSADLKDQLEETAGLLARWRLDDEEGSFEGVESGPFGLPPLLSTLEVPRFAADPLPWSSDTQLRGGLEGVDPLFMRSSFSRDFGYPGGQGGVYSFWMTVNSFTADNTTFARVTVVLNNAHPVRVSFNGQSSGELLIRSDMPSGGPTVSAAMTPFVPVFVSIVVDVNGANQRNRVYLDGVLASTVERAVIGTSSADLSASRVDLTLSQTILSPADFLMSRVTHTLELPAGEVASGLGNVRGLLQVVNAAVPALNMNISADLWDAPISSENAGSSALAVINNALKVEQGYIYPTTSGTLTNPSTEIVVRERTRPLVVDYTFVTTEDILGAPRMGRDLNDTVSLVSVLGPTATVIVAAPELRPLVGDASVTESSLLQRDGDLRLWGQDRVKRGTNNAIDVYEFTVDAKGTDADRWGDLLGMVPGDRVRISGLPETQIGFAEYDGWLIGGSETHTPERNLFSFLLARTLSEPRFDTDRFMSAGDLTLSAGINSAVTSFSIASSGALLSTTEEPYDIVVGSERMTVTNCTTTTPQVVTVTRAVNGTTPASHSSGAIVTSAPDSLFGF